MDWKMSSSWWLPLRCGRGSTPYTYHMNEDIPNATVFIQRPKKKPLLPCKARDGISQRVWCPSCCAEQGQGPGSSLQPQYLTHTSTCRVGNFTGGFTCSMGRSCFSGLVCNKVPLPSYAKVTSFDILQLGHGMCGSAALQTHNQGTEIQHLSGYTGIRTLNNPILSGSPPSLSVGVSRKLLPR